MPNREIRALVDGLARWRAESVRAGSSEVAVAELFRALTEKDLAKVGVVAGAGAIPGLDVLVAAERERRAGGAPWWAEGSRDGFSVVTPDEARPS